MSEHEETVEKDDLHKALDEMNLLKEKDKEVYRIDSETIELSDIEYKLIENYKDAFDLELMEQRYSDYLLKYDYIVGDMAYQKLRLRGFFDDQRKGVPIDMKISNLEDYLIEYCNFGSAYFVFERVDKRKSDPESYFKKKKGKSSKNRSRNKKNKGKSNRSKRQSGNKNQPKK